MAQKLPPELEQLVLKYQQIESQLASVVSQKGAVLSELKEVERALAVVKEVDEATPVYRNTGFVLVKTSKEDVVKELENRKEELQIRLTSLEKMENLLKKQLDDIKNKINKLRTGAHVTSKES